MSKSRMIELEHELTGFHPGNEGTSLVAYSKGSTGTLLVSLSARYAVDFKEDEDGWAWAPSTHLNRQQVAELRDFLTNVLEES